MGNQEQSNGRLHDPTLRELTAQLDDLKELFTEKHETLVKIMDERDKLYTERAMSSKTAIDAALKSADTLTTAAFNASEKAVSKSDINAEKWRENANEWRAAMMDREVKFASRPETENEFKNLRAELASLKESRAESHGGKTSKDDTRSNIAIILSFVGLMAIILFKVIGK